jgi:hypothetical protein
MPGEIKKHIVECLSVLSQYVLCHFWPVADQFGEVVG